jgi:hypothetical protein
MPGLKARMVHTPAEEVIRGMVPTPGETRAIIREAATQLLLCQLHVLQPGWRRQGVTGELVDLSPGQWVVRLREGENAEIVERRMIAFRRRIAEEVRVARRGAWLCRYSHRRKRR